MGFPALSVQEVYCTDTLTWLSCFGRSEREFPPMDFCVGNIVRDEAMYALMEQVSEVAQEYCALIETAAKADDDWLVRLAQILPRLHAAIAGLEDPGDPVDIAEWSDLDARFELYAELHDLLGTRDGYWMEFDVAHDNQCMSGSLADDLTDIYCELKQRLALLEQEPTKACSSLSASYTVHWGRHLVDAERHLYELRSRNQL